MGTSTDLFGRHLLDLAKRAESNNVFTFSDFLGLSEQNDFSRIKHEISVPFSLFGGTEGCERVMVRFGDAESFGYEVLFPIVCLRVTPKQMKFADALSHRDYLGAILNLGVNREVLGDIIVRKEEAFLFCEEKIASFIKDNLLRVKHTDVNVETADDLPAGALYHTETVTVTVTSVRLDALLARVYCLSRDDAQNAVEKGLVFADGREVTTKGYVVKDGSVISYRGFGRFIFRGVVGNSKKGKDVVVIEKYV